MWGKRAVEEKTDDFHLSERKTGAAFAKTASWWGNQGFVFPHADFERPLDGHLLGESWRAVLDPQEARIKTRPKATCPEEKTRRLGQSTSHLAPPRLCEVKNLLLHRFEDAVSLEFHKRKQNIPCALRRQHKQHIPMGRGRGSTVPAYV